MQIKRLDHHFFRKLFKRWFLSEYRKKIEQISLQGSLNNQAFDSKPLIVLGMHSSGTSLLIKTIGKLGVFTSDVTGPDTSESLFFQYINDAVLACCQGHWSTPEPLGHANLNPVWKEALIAVIYMALKSKWRYLYRFASPDNCLLEDKIPWSWKDPRNSLTVDFWRQLFPNARFVFIYRHGLDVAESLVRREHKKGRSMYISRCLELNGAFQMWESYNRMALNGLDSVDQQNQLHICFEEMAINPKKELKRLAEFCELSLSDTLMLELLVEINSDKAYAYKKMEVDGDTKELHTTLLTSEILNKLGYC